jgi:hypothetical protein
LAAARYFPIDILQVSMGAFFCCAWRIASCGSFYAQLPVPHIPHVSWTYKRDYDRTPGVVSLLIADG